MRKGKKVLLVWIETELMQKINDYQHLNKHQFRSDAVKSLLRCALEFETRKEVEKEKLAMADQAEKDFSDWAAKTIAGRG